MQIDKTSRYKEIKDFLSIAEFEMNKISNVERLFNDDWVEYHACDENQLLGSMYNYDFIFRITPTPVFILCAAIKHNDMIISGHRHSDCNDILKKLGIDITDRKNDGFLTSNGKFVDRYEAWKIAESQNQIKFGYKAVDPNNKILTSENLY